MRAWISPALLAAACTAPAPTPPAAPTPTPTPAPSAAPPAPTPAADASAEAPPARVVPPVSEILRDGFEARYRERALPTADRNDAPPRPAVAKESGRARLIFADSSVRVLVWTADAELWETPLAVTPLTRAPAKAGPRERVLLAPGAFVTRKSEKNGFVAVSANDREVSVEGYLPAAALGRVYLPAEVPPVTQGEDWVWSRDAKLTASPGGAALGKILDTADPEVHVTQLARGASWFVEVEYRSPSLLVRGFVPKSALSQPEPGSYGRGYGTAGHRNPPEEELTFATGTCLYAEPWGEVIGVLREPRTAKVHVEDGERAAWRELHYPWFGIHVWVPREGASTSPPTKDAPLSLADGFSCLPAPKH